MYTLPFYWQQYLSLCLLSSYYMNIIVHAISSQLPPNRFYFLGPYISLGHLLHNGQQLLYQNDKYFWRTGFVFIQSFFTPMPRIWLPCVYIVPGLQSTPTFALHFNAPWISSCHSWTQNVFTLTTKNAPPPKKWVYYNYSVDAPVTVQTESKVLSRRTAFHPLSRNTVISSHR